MSRLVCWVDGSLRPADAAAVRADDSAFHEGRGCYTTVHVRSGRPRFLERHLRRLADSSHALGLPPADPRQLRRAVEELGRAAFGNGDGIVRIQLSRDGAGTLHTTGTARSLGADRGHWRAITAPLPHPGAILPGGPKLTARPHFAMADEAARDAGADEALFFDAAGRLVEGARSNLVVQREDGEIVTPPDERGAVAGVALACVRDALPSLRHRDVSRRGVLAARGVVALNAVRGARPLISLDQTPLGPGGPALAEELNQLLEAS